MTAKEMEKSIQEVWELFRETDRRFKETDKEIEKLSKITDRKIAEMSQSVAALTGKWRRFVEGLIAPAVKELFKEKEIDVERVYPRAKSYKNGQKMAIDILAVNSDSAVLIEAKSTLSVDDVKDHLQTLAEFKTFFPEYANRKVFGCVAGIVIDEGADRFAYKNGLFVIAQSGDTVKILNDEKFQPRIW